MPGVIAYFIVGGVAAIATFVATPLARKAANRFEIISAPDERDVHESPTPNLGGPAMLFGLLAGSLAAWLIGDFSAVFSSTPCIFVNFNERSPDLFKIGFF